MLNAAVTLPSMRFRALLLFPVLLAACSGEVSPSTTGLPPPSTLLAPGDIVTPDTTSPDAPPLACEPPFIGPVVLPDRVVSDTPDPATIVIDKWLAQPATAIGIWTDADGDPVVALVRGALPPERWSDAPERIEVMGVEAALGPLSDDMWAAAWFDGPDRCDDYSLYIYPPTTQDEAREIAVSVSASR